LRARCSKCRKVGDYPMSQWSWVRYRGSCRDRMVCPVCRKEAEAYERNVLSPSGSLVYSGCVKCPSANAFFNAADWLPIRDQSMPACSEHSVAAMGAGVSARLLRSLAVQRFMPRSTHRF